MIGIQPWPETGIDGFTRGFATIDGTRIHYVTGGRPDSEVIVLFPGFPQTWYAWRKILPILGATYRIVAPDLPGQGDSDRPLSGFDTASVAKLVLGLMERLGVQQHYLAAHDVGAWVAYPYVSMFGNRVKALAILDTGIPGISLPDNLPWAAHVAWRTWHVAFHNLPDLPEALIEGREDYYLRWFLQRKAANPQIFVQADFDEYARTFKLNGLKGGLGYYRAVTQSAEQNRNLAAKAKLEMPVLAVRADQGSMPDLVAQLKVIATDVTGTAIADCGHYLAEEQPEALARELEAFFK
jgi:pimeloyl-ACP methyl ester carboxylesterase